MERQIYRFDTATNAAAFAARLEREYRTASLVTVQRTGRAVHVASAAAHVWSQIAGVEQLAEARVMQAASLADPATQAVWVREPRDGARPFPTNGAWLRWADTQQTLAPARRRRAA